MRTVVVALIGTTAVIIGARELARRFAVADRLPARPLASRESRVCSSEGWAPRSTRPRWT